MGRGDAARKKARAKEARRRERAAVQAAGPPRKPPGCTPEQHRRLAERTAPTPRLVARRERYDGGRVLSKAEFRALLRLLGYETYAAYLWSPVWLEMRRKVLKRARGRCEDCGGRAAEVHHLRYTEENVRGLSLEALLALCAGCHERRHGGRRQNA